VHPAAGWAGLARGGAVKAKAFLILTARVYRVSAVGVPSDAITLYPARVADARQPREPAAVTPRQPDASAASGQTVTTRNYRVVQTTRALRGNHAPGDRVIKRLPLAVAAGGVEIENCQFAIKKI
jgi:hypothetical protein